MSAIADRLSEAGYSLPDTPQALGSYVPAVRAGSLVFTAGQLPLRGGALLTSGAVGVQVTVDQARLCAAQCALNALAAASIVCDLDEVVGVVKVTGYVASGPGFTSQPTVIDGASAVVLAAFGDAGRHARVAVGVSELPLGAPVEIELVLRLTDS